MVALEVAHRTCGQLDAREPLDRGGADRVQLGRCVDDRGKRGGPAARNLAQRCPRTTSWILQCSLPSGWMNRRGTRNVPRLRRDAPPSLGRGHRDAREHLGTRPVPARSRSAYLADAREHSKGKSPRHPLFRVYGPVSSGMPDASAARTRTRRVGALQTVPTAAVVAHATICYPSSRRRTGWSPYARPPSPTLRTCRHARTASRR